MYTIEQLGIPSGPENVNSLTIDEIRAELKKITDVEDCTGFLYFLYNYVCISHPSRGKVKMREDIYQWQIQAAKDFLKHKNVISKKTRQLGYSTLVGAYALWRALFFVAQSISIVSITQRDSIVFLKRIKFIYDSLPLWLQQKTSEFAKTQVVFEHNDSSITSLPNTEDPARGSSLSLLIVDEFAMFKNAKDVLGAAVPALSVGSLTSFTNKSLPSQFFIISTLPRHPIDNEYLRILHESQEKLEDAEFYIIETPTDDIPHYQDEKWRKSQLAALGNRLYSIEILGEEVYDSENLLLPLHILESLKHTPPIRVDFLKPDDVNDEGYYKDFDIIPFMKDNFDVEYNYIKTLWIWKDPIPEKEYGIVCDVAGGRSNDKSTALVFDLETNEQVAEYFDKIDTERFKTILEILLEYYNNAKLSIESTGLGTSLCDYFGDTINYEKFYWYQKAKKKMIPGYPMSVKNRPNAIMALQSILIKHDVENPNIILHSVRLVNQLKNFGYTKTGKIAGLNGQDDLVMTLAQYAHLRFLNFMVTDKFIESKLAFGVLTEEEEKKEEEKNELLKPIRNIAKKYWHYDFDLEMTEETENMLKMMLANGDSIPLELLERVIK